MQEKAQLYLHIGHPKAGSTTLQSFLFKNFALLNQEGFALPTAKLETVSEGKMPGNPLLALQRIQKSNDITPLRQWIIEAGQSHRKLILSSECLFLWNWHKLFMHLTDLIDIHLFYYVRRQDELMLSAWRQWNLKSGQSLEDFIDNRLLKQQPNFWSNIAPWRNKVGLASLHVRFIAPDFLTGGDILQDFASQIKIDFSNTHPVENQNTSIDARLMLFMNKHPEMFNSSHDDRVFSLLSSTIVDPKETKHLTLTQSQFDRIYGTFEENNQAFLKKFHPEAHGTPVIDPTNARIEKCPTPITELEQEEFVRQRLLDLGKHPDPRIQALRSMLNMSN